MARGTIIKRKTKTKGVVYDIKYRTADGTQIKQAVGPAGRRHSVRLNEALAAVQAGAQRTTSTEKFADVADRWLAQKEPRIEASTYRDYEIHLRQRLKPAFGDLKLRQITRDADRGLPGRSGRRGQAQPQDDQRQPDPAAPDPRRRRPRRRPRDEPRQERRPRPTRSSCPTSARRCTT